MMRTLLAGMALSLGCLSAARAEESQEGMGIQSAFVGEDLVIVVFESFGSQDRTFFGTGAPGAPLVQLDQAGMMGSSERVGDAWLHSYSIGFERTGRPDGRLELGAKSEVLEVACGGDRIPLEPMPEDQVAALQDQVRRGETELVPLVEQHRPLAVLQVKGSDEIALVEEGRNGSMAQVFYGVPGAMKPLRVTGGASPRARHEWWVSIQTAEGVDLFVERGGRGLVNGERARRLSRKRAVLRRLGIPGVPDGKHGLDTPCD